MWGCETVTDVAALWGLIVGMRVWTDDVESRESEIVGRRVTEGAYRSCRSHDAALCPALEWTPLAVTITL